MDMNLSFSGVEELLEIGNTVLLILSTVPLANHSTSCEDQPVGPLVYTQTWCMAQTLRRLCQDVGHI